MRGCRADCQHRQFVRAYQEERERQETQAENDYRDRDGNDRAEKLITFKDYLVGMTGWSR